jgi:uncharacterized protein (TIGR03000 family)
MRGSSQLRVVALAALLGAFALTGGLVAQEKAKKASATITVLVPDPTYKTTVLKVNDTEVEGTGEKRVIKTKLLEPGKDYKYRFEALIEPNNYTKITRVREITVKAGDKLKLAMLKDDNKKFRDKVVIRWVPTPRDVAKRMGELAKTKKTDVVYDLGCGDGIMLITAVKELGAKKGIGVDLNPKRVREALKAAKDAGIAEKIEVRQGDILDVKNLKDLPEANVVLLYLGNEMNIRLRPILWKMLKPGTRVVSHRFTMGDWKPEKTIMMKGEDGDEYELHLWTITGKEGKK